MFFVKTICSRVHACHKFMVRAKILELAIGSRKELTMVVKSTNACDRCESTENVENADCDCEHVCEGCKMDCCNRCQGCTEQCDTCEQCEECCECEECEECGGKCDDLNETVCECGEMCDDCTNVCRKSGCNKRFDAYCKKHLKMCDKCDTCKSCCNKCEIDCSFTPISYIESGCIRCSHSIVLCQLHSIRGDGKTSKFCIKCSIQCKGCEKEFHGDYRDYKPGHITTVCKNWYRSVDLCRGCKVKAHEQIVDKPVVPVDPVVDIILDYLHTEIELLDAAEKGYERANKRARLANEISSQIRAPLI